MALQALRQESVYDESECAVRLLLLDERCHQRGSAPRSAKVTVADFYRHVDACDTCCGRRLCALGEEILRQAADDTAARVAGVEVVDLDGHVRACVDCRAHSLCAVGRAIAKRAGDVIRETQRKVIRA
jgi:hypothetical protein